MIDHLLHQILLIISVLFQSLISAEHATCNECMADIYGPYPENKTEINSTAIVKATESVPAVIVCRYLCYDQNYMYYNFDLSIDILDPKLQSPKRRIIAVTPHEESNYNFTVIPNSVQTCDLLSNINETIIKYWIHVGSSDVPTLIAKCFVQYSPNGLPSSIRCSNSSTLAIIPGYSIPDPDTSSSIASSKTISLSPSPCMLSTVSHYLTETVTVTVTVSITATPRSSPTATFDDLSGNCTDMRSTTSVHAILWPVVVVLIATLFLILGIIVWLKYWRTPGGTKKIKVNQVTDSDNSSSATIHKNNYACSK